MNAQYFISIDCSHNIQVTLLASDFSVIENFESDSLPSQTLHKIIHELVSKNSIDISQIATFFLCLGPGSYTALRMIKGFKEICEYDGKLTCGFTYIDALKILVQDIYRFA